MLAPFPCGGHPYVVRDQDICGPPELFVSRHSGHERFTVSISHQESDCLVLNGGADLRIFEQLYL